MSVFRTLPLWGALALGLAWQPARAAEDYDSCTGFIDALPATIATQGTWCLRKDLSTAISQGAAITVAASNVTIDCNDFKIGGMGAGVGTLARGIWTDNRANTTVRNCSVRGFQVGLRLSGPGHLVEDNRLEGNTAYAIWLESDGALVRRNQLLNTGGTPSFNAATALYILNGSVDVLDNTIDGVIPSSNFASGSATGIRGVRIDGSVIAGNRVRNLVAVGSGYTNGIWVNRYSPVFYGGPATWAQARNECAALGARLAVVDSASKADLYATYASSAGQPLWVGGSDEVQEGNWTWISGQAFDYSRWAAGQPDNAGGNEHYLAIDPDGSWFDAPASAQYGYVCDYEEKRASILVHDNVVRGNGAVNSYGILSQCVAANNIVSAQEPIGCFDAGGNQVSP